MNMPKKYNFSERESYWQNFWERKRVYEFKPTSNKPLYTIDTPPPTISGVLHLGHIYSYTQAEVIARFRRMAGYNIRYPFGLDNNGLPTERLVEKEKGIHGKDMDLTSFVSICLEVTEKYRRKYEKLWRSIGLSVDWRLEYSTISPEVQKISQTAFKELYDKDLIERREAPALYCYECRTSVAQAEVEDEKKDSVFYDLAFQKQDGSDLAISTTRPELLPACVGVFVHPEDTRYKEIIGQKVTTPLGDEVKIRTDEKVLREKGTGVVMCCTYGDEVDVGWVREYGLEEKVILDEDGKFRYTKNAPEIKGKLIKEARGVIVEVLKRNKAIKREKKIRHTLRVHERCSTPIEFIPRTQWFVKILDRKNELLEAGKKIRWYPIYMKKRYEDWVNGLKWDWSISRERFFGISIPAFICEECNEIMIPEKTELPINPKTEAQSRNCPHCKHGRLKPETRLLDTWFTTALTPDINNLYPLNKNLIGKMYPLSLRPQAHDIIRTWAVYTILMGIYRHQEIPWDDLMISGHILVKKGEKISKKTGGGKYKPEELIATHSADAIRYAMCQAKLGKDSYYDDSQVRKGKKLVSKIYNVARLALNNLLDFEPKSEINERKLKASDRWILQRVRDTAKRMRREFERYEFGRALIAFEDFFWPDFTDNYLEIVKGRLYRTGDNWQVKRKSAQYALYKTFLDVLKMASPFLPHITEEVYHAECMRKDKTEQQGEIISDGRRGYFFRNEGQISIHLTSWPAKSEVQVDQKIRQGAQLMLSIISQVRKHKSQRGISIASPIALLSVRSSREKRILLEPFIEDIIYVCRAEKFKFSKHKKQKQVIDSELIISV